MGVLDSVFRKYGISASSVKELTEPPNPISRKNSAKGGFRKSGLYRPNQTHQMDLLELPEDIGGEHYLLVVTDIATGATDARPLAQKTMELVYKNVLDIYEGKATDFYKKYLKQPRFIHVDGGKEFNKTKIEMIKKKVGVRVAMTARHKSQSHVEYMNRIIGGAIMKLQLNNAVAVGGDDSKATDWVEYLP